MKEENEAILVAMIIGAVILGIGLAMFFNRPYAGYGAVVLAIGLMTLSLIITMRAEEIIHLKIYPTAARSEDIEVSVDTPPSTESTEPYEAQVEEAQQVQELEETEQYYTPSIYEPLPSQEVETGAQETEEPQETSFAETEQEQEPDIEASSSSSEQNQDTEEPQESTTTW